MMSKSLNLTPISFMLGFIEQAQKEGNTLLIYRKIVKDIIASLLTKLEPKYNGRN